MSSLKTPELIQSLDDQIFRELERYLASVASAYAAPLGQAFDARERELQIRFRDLADQIDMHARRLAQAAAEAHTKLEQEVDQNRQTLRDHATRVGQLIEETRLAADRQQAVAHDEVRRQVSEYLDEIGTRVEAALHEFDKYRSMVIQEEGRLSARLQVVTDEAIASLRDETEVLRAHRRQITIMSGLQLACAVVVLVALVIGLR